MTCNTCTASYQGSYTGSYSNGTYTETGSGYVDTDIEAGFPVRESITSNIDNCLPGNTLYLDHDACSNRNNLRMDLRVNYTPYSEIYRLAKGKEFKLLESSTKYLNPTQIYLKYRGNMP